MARGVHSRARRLLLRIAAPPSSATKGDPVIRVRRGILLTVHYSSFMDGRRPRRRSGWSRHYLGINLAGDAEFRRGGPGASGGYLGDRLGVRV